MTEIMKASQQWFSRPDDERFLDLQSLYQSTLDRSQISEPRLVTNRHIQAVPLDGANRGLVVDLDGEMVAPTNWAFNQLCVRAEAPASYMRKIHQNLAADCLNYGLGFLSEVDTSAIALVTESDDEMSDMRAVTSSTYGRIWDHEVVRAVIDMNQDERWHVPAQGNGVACITKRSTTLYAGDRDCFIFLVDPANVIEIGHEKLFRGFIVWNSEVGHCVFGFMTFLYRYVCDNRIIWGAEDIRELRVRHTVNAPDRFLREAQPILRQYAETGTQKTVEAVKRAMDKKVGKNDDAVVEFMRKRNYTKKQSEEILRSAIAEEGEARSVWNMVNGATALARSIPNAYERVEAERKASSLMNLVAA